MNSIKKDNVNDVVNNIVNDIMNDSANNIVNDIRGCKNSSEHPVKWVRFIPNQHFNFFVISTLTSKHHQYQFQLFSLLFSKHIISRQQQRHFLTDTILLLKGSN